MKKNKVYNRIKISFTIADYIIILIYLSILSFTGLSKTIYNYLLSSGITNSYVLLLLFLFACSILISVITVPLSFINDYIIEHYFKLSNQNILRYIIENLKSLLISLIISVPLILLFYFILQKFHTLWWLPVGIVMFLFSVLLSKIAPVVILPLFYKLSPLEDNELKDKIKNMIQGSKLKIEGVFKINISKNTKKATAAFTGFGKTKKVLLGDTLIEKMTADQITSVFAHELIHFEKKHIFKQMAIGFIFSFLGLYLAGFLHNKIVTMLGYSGITEIASLPVIGFILFIYNFITTPLSNAISRYYEKQADIEGCKRMNNKDDFINALKILEESNLADARPNKAVEILFYSHPPIGTRIKYIKESV